MFDHFVRSFLVLHENEAMLCDLQDRLAFRYRIGTHSPNWVDGQPQNETSGRKLAVTYN